MCHERASHWEPPGDVYRRLRPTSPEVDNAGWPAAETTLLTSHQIHPPISSSNRQLVHSIDTLEGSAQNWDREDPLRWEPGTEGPSGGQGGTLQHLLNHGDSQRSGSDYAFTTLVDQGVMRYNVPYSGPADEARTSPKPSSLLDSPESRVNTGSMAYAHSPQPQNIRLRNPNPPALPFVPLQGPPMIAPGGDEDTEMEDDPPTATSSPQICGISVPGPRIAAPEKFRFHVTLNAPTAMIKHTDEIPVTYVNKGQTYSITVVDTELETLGPTIAGYRTAVCISFDDEQQRSTPAACWRLWVKGRGTSEAHQHGGKLQAVEHMSLGRPVSDRTKRATAHLDTASFNGFTVFWSPTSSGSAECNVNMRFNFLSTDFSLSKGVKGMASRLCVKTEAITAGSQNLSVATSEICYCKVKIFRDHGAERKLSNDATHISKAIGRLTDRNAPTEARARDSWGRKRSGKGSVAVQPTSPTGRAPKRRRTMSASFTSFPSEPPDNEGKIHAQILVMRDMFTSSLSVSVLNLRGDELDDPDLYPVYLPDDPRSSVEITRRGSASWLQHQQSTSGGCPRIDETPQEFPLLFPAPPQRPQGLTHYGLANAPWSPLTARASYIEPQQLADPSAQLVRIRKRGEASANTLTNWMYVLDFDLSYEPPATTPPKPVACFFILYHRTTPPSSSSSSSPFPPPYHAIYLFYRTAHELASRIALKFHLDHSRIRRTLRLDPQGRRIVIDDNAVRETEEGQDMLLSIERIGRMRDQGPASEDGCSDDCPGEDEDGNAFFERETQEQRDESYELLLSF
ncbi:MAG: hypothetical protein M1840_009084 [Geoglossum simile]|nr:MAG: hypothetical protein M1840_009084 [Geoglossum simile]